MAHSTLLKLACVLLACLVVAAAAARATVTCGQVSSALASCIPYGRSGTGPVPASCCNGIKFLNSAARTTPDHQATCKCLKSVSRSISGLNYGVVARLPEKCKVSIPYKISPSTNCDSVK
ncbi:hypothetical protein NL676_018789 [Syzygium grande]|nr:hypothetical protein NL676_018789 [Syzygium grande]